MQDTGPKDYRTRSYLSAVEAANYLNLTVEKLHHLVGQSIIKAQVSASGQMRFDLAVLKGYEQDSGEVRDRKKKTVERINTIVVKGTTQQILVADSMKMSEILDESIHLMITSPPYFDTKMYSREPIEHDLGNIHDEDHWFEMIGQVWKEVFRVLQPGRKAFINIMNLPVRLENGSFRSLNLVGKTIDLCEKIGFIFKRDIVWHKTNAVRAHFGTYPYPGGILLNNMHEFILEFEKPGRKGFEKYGHLSNETKEKSKLDKDFWVEIKKSDVWVMKPQGSGDRRSHIAPFPYELPYRLIKAYSYKTETILDPFAGSGTALRAARDLERNGIGYEINPEIALDAITNIKCFQAEIDDCDFIE
ncbi:MAG: site-specific DNA-methyltransferase [Euryarchaeota archaeon]|nr:site-specific DNA-methyltransferase [Euryarchaeota archaeon]